MTFLREVWNYAIDPVGFIVGIIGISIHLIRRSNKAPCEDSYVP